MYKTSLKFITFTVLLVMALPAFAEYRVYQYYVKSKFPRLEDQKSYLITSTLNPTSYLSYHGGNSTLKVDLLRTWMCKGYTGAGKEYCRAPLESSLPKEES
jgi:hypothetical protein